MNTVKFSEVIPNGGDWVEYREEVAGGAPVVSRINRRTGEYIVIRGDRIAERGFDAGKRGQIMARSVEVGKGGAI